MAELANRAGPSWADGINWRGLLRRIPRPGVARFVETGPRMSWLQAKRRHTQSPDSPRGGEFEMWSWFAAPKGNPPQAIRGRRAAARSIAVVSGKGGTGKSVVTASLAQLFSRRGRTLIADGDLGVGNAHILQDISPRRTFADVVEGSASVRDVLESCGPNLDLIAGGCGVAHLAQLSSCEMHLLAAGLEEVEGEYRHLIVDGAAGLSNQTLGFAMAADLTLIVTTSDLTAMTDAYAFLKVLLGRRPDCPVLLVVNRVSSEEEGRRAADRIARVSTRFLAHQPEFMGSLPDDPAVTRSVNHRSSVLSADPGCSWAAAMRNLAARLAGDLDRLPARGLGRTLRLSLAAAHL